VGANYDGDQFPSEYRGEAFACQQGSWNRQKRTGLQGDPRAHVCRPPNMRTFMTRFFVNASSVWARPVGVAVAHDGALLVTENGNGMMWRVSYRGGP
jgi:glucose/arabinose dehydrogenase